MRVKSDAIVYKRQYNKNHWNCGKCKKIIKCMIICAIFSIQFFLVPMGKHFESLLTPITLKLINGRPWIN